MPWIISFSVNLLGVYRLWFKRTVRFKRTRPACWEGRAKGPWGPQQPTPDPKLHRPDTTLSKLPPVGCLSSLVRGLPVRMSLQSENTMAGWAGQLGHAGSCMQPSPSWVWFHSGLQVHLGALGLGHQPLPSPPHAHLVTRISHRLKTAVLSMLCIFVYKLRSQTI